MMTNKIFTKGWVVVASLAVAFSFSACSDDETTNGGETNKNIFSDIPVSFSAVTKDAQSPADAASAKEMQLIETRAQYSGDVYNSGNGQTLYWENGDDIKVYQFAYNPTTNAIGNKDTDGQSFSITPSSDDNKKAVLNQDNSYHWVNVNEGEKIRFYGVYPDNGNVTSCELATSGDNWDNSAQFKVTAKVPKEQDLTVSSTTLSDETLGTIAVAQASSTQLLMIASGDKAYSTGENVSLTFKPIYSALTITIREPKNNTTVYVSGVNLYFKDANGDFYALPDEITYSYSNAGDEPICNSIEEGATSTSTGIHVSLHANKDTKDYVALGGTGNPDAIRVTVLLPPYLVQYGVKSIYANVETKLYSSDSPSSTANPAPLSAKNITIGAKNNNTKFEASTRKFITLSYMKTSVDNWMDPIPDDVLMTQLSIPGAWRATQSTDMATGRVNGDNTNGNGKDVCSPTQWATVPSMLDAGIRALDLRITYDSSKPNQSGTGNFSAFGNHFYANCAGDPSVGESATTSVLASQLRTWLKAHPSETIIILVGAERAYGLAYDSNARDRVQEFIEALDDEKTTDTNGHTVMGVVQLSSNLTLGDCRGNFVVIERPDAENRCTVSTVSSAKAMDWRINSYCQVGWRNTASYGRNSESETESTGMDRMSSLSKLPSSSYTDENYPSGFGTYSATNNNFRTSTLYYTYKNVTSGLSTKPQYTNESGCTLRYYDDEVIGPMTGSYTDGTATWGPYENLTNKTTTSNLDEMTIFAQFKGRMSKMFLEGVNSQADNVWNMCYLPCYTATGQSSDGFTTEQNISDQKNIFSGLAGIYDGSAGGGTTGGYMTYVQDYIRSTENRVGIVFMSFVPGYNYTKTNGYSSFYDIARDVVSIIHKNYSSTLKQKQ